ncbi:beta-galactosidase [bacterium]|nr:beta-galactosidase [bacterium]
MEAKLYQSAAYYPELWPLDQIDNDIQRMQTAGLNAVRITEFAWSRMEPEEGKYDFEWLQLTLDKLHAAGIGAILCTPTPTPPAWLTEKHPEMLFVNRDDKTMIHGARRHYCYNSPVYREHSARITTEIARRFGRHPAVIGWQTDNEFFCHVQACYCDTCREKFHGWLDKRYGSIEKLNTAWGTHLWSQYYNRFDQIPLPKPTVTLHNRSLETTFLQFASDSMVDFQQHQLDIIRQHSPHPITHNAMPPFHRLDYDDLFDNLDFASIDLYLAPNDWWRAFYEFDWMRTKCNSPYWMMETDAGWMGATENGEATWPDGFVRMKGLATYGFGGQGISYWVFRQQRSGCEMQWGSLFYSWGNPTPRLNEVQDIATAQKKIEAFLFDAPVPQAEVGIHTSNLSHLILHNEAMTPGFTYFSNWFERAYRPLLETGIFRDVLFPKQDVSDYKVVYTPFMPALTDAVLAKMKTFVTNGGTWICGPMTGYRTPDHTVPTTAALGELEAWAGIPVEYFVPMPNGITKVQLNCGKPATAQYHAAIFKENLSGTTPLGHYLDGVGAGRSFAVEKSIGKGKLVLLGACLDIDSQRVLLGQLLKKENVNYQYDVTWGTTVAPRTGKKRSGLVVVNWDGKGGAISLPKPGIDLLTGDRKMGRINLKPFEVLVVEFDA